ncbi:hypothetical protein KXR53_09640 [Inquilinus limosus]|uniref:hypothetical protein n=1 Tax=Inquilinus limosus TaxID=171674 RepID=UPI003F18798E
MAFVPISRRPFRPGLLRRLLTWRPALRSVEMLPQALRRDVGLTEGGLTDRR